MDNYQQNLLEETAYLQKTLDFLRREINTEDEVLSYRMKNLVGLRRDMWENTAHFTNDFDKLTEINQYLPEVASQTSGYCNTAKQLERYKKTLSTPYFGRFDFRENGSTAKENIYIGLYSVMDSKTYEVYVYDWRAPISSVFYRSELGEASYCSPVGTISGEVLLKRQYKIQNSQLKYFFDCSIRISDEILQEVLGRNATPKMRNIVETIQKEQDIIIRDTENELLIVQGVAGSGKTSIALHRVAFLLYAGMNSNLSSKNILIISPNEVFSTYISSVLPELGEENVEQTTFESIAYSFFGGRVIAETRNSQFESLILSQNDVKGFFRKQSAQFKGSRTFVEILNRFLHYFERNMLAFEDIYYSGKVIATKQQLKNRFLNKKIVMPTAKRLTRIENMLLEKVHPLQKKRLEKIQEIVHRSDGHQLEVKSFSRLLAIKEAKKFMARLRRFTAVDYLSLYYKLFNECELFLKLSNGLELPENIEQIIAGTKENLEKGYAFYEDCAPLLYLKLLIEGSESFSDIKHVIIDEAQDYCPVQFEVFKLLFKDAKYTVLGDINQAIDKEIDKSYYDVAAEILAKKKAVKLFLHKSYRSSFEINAFSQKLLNKEQQQNCFERHDKEPIVAFFANQALLDQTVARDIDYYFAQGYESIAVICKTQEEAKITYARLTKLTKIKLIDANEEEIEKGALVIPAYSAKGLEFDAVIIYNVDKNNYASALDQKLLYIACTRALHRLTLYYTGEKSSLI